MADSAVTNYRDELLGLMLRQLRDHAILLMDTEGRIVSWLGAAEKIMGYSEAEMLGEKLDLIFSSDDQKHRHPYAGASRRRRRWPLRERSLAGS